MDDCNLPQKENIRKRKWLVFANDNVSDYCRAFDDAGCIYLDTKNRKFRVRDFNKRVFNYKI